MAYILFLLVNATLFIRPAEVIPALAGVPLYYLLILPCIVLTLPAMLNLLFGRELPEQPITVGVFAMLAATLLSHLSHLNFSLASIVLQDFGKVVLYYLLLVCLVNTKARLRLFLAWLVILTVVASGLALIHYHGIVEIPACEPAKDGEVDEMTGEAMVIRRLCSSGIFHDPNDLCLILVTSMAICLYGVTDGRLGLLRALWLAPLVLFGYALTLTYSRGGFVALLASLMILFYARFGWRKAIPLAILAVPAMFLLFGGRQTDLSTSGDTGQQRIQAWAEGLELFRRAPLFGIGEGRFVDEIGKVAHNSYVHAYTELGFFGGTVFLSIYYLSLRIPYRLDVPRLGALDAELGRLRPYLIALAAGYGAGMLTLSRCYIVPTYLYPGLITAYARLAGRELGMPAERLDMRLVRHLSLVSLAFVTVAYIYIRLSARWGGGG